MTLDKEEMDLLKSFERGEWRASKGTVRKSRLKSYARANLAKNARINIRVPSSTLTELQSIAMDEGIPYQTMIASILHKFVNGKLVEVKRK